MLKVVIEEELGHSVKEFSTLEAGKLHTTRFDKPIQIKDTEDGVMPIGYNRLQIWNGNWKSNATLPEEGNYIGEILIVSNGATNAVTIETVNTTLNEPFVIPGTSADSRNGITAIWDGAVWNMNTDVNEASGGNNGVCESFDLEFYDDGALTNGYIVGSDSKTTNISIPTGVFAITLTFETTDGAISGLSAPYVDNPILEELNWVDDNTISIGATEFPIDEYVAATYPPKLQNYGEIKLLVNGEVIGNTHIFKDTNTVCGGTVIVKPNNNNEVVIGYELAVKEGMSAEFTSSLTYAISEIKCPTADEEGEQ